MFGKMPAEVGTKSAVKVYSEKLIISGRIIERIQYEQPKVVGGLQDKAEKRARSPESVTDQEKQANRGRSMQRAKTTLRRLISANAGGYHDKEGKPYKPVFLTLTFRENITEQDRANKEFMKFVKRLNYKVFGEKKARLKYAVVVEFQKRGAIHYHAIFFNLPYIKAKELATTWRQGFIKLNAIDDCDNVGAYVTKYMSKDNVDERLRGRKSYFTSRGLVKPVEVCDQKEIDQLVAGLSEYEVFTKTYESEYQGLITYTQYNLNRPKQAIEIAT